jgi:hypothetical protein
MTSCFQSIRILRPHRGCPVLEFRFMVGQTSDATNARRYKLLAVSFCNVMPGDYESDPNSQRSLSAYLAAVSKLTRRLQLGEFWVLSASFEVPEVTSERLSRRRLRHYASNLAVSRL